jgi:hypothetical protein
MVKLAGFSFSVFDRHIVKAVTPFKQTVVKIRMAMKINAKM